MDAPTALPPGKFTRQPPTDNEFIIVQGLRTSVQDYTSGQKEWNASRTAHRLPSNADIYNILVGKKTKEMQEKIETFDGASKNAHRLALNIRNTLMSSLMIENMSRSGELGSLTLKTLTSATIELTTRRHMMRVYAHKTFKGGAAHMSVDDEMYRW